MIIEITGVHKIKIENVMRDMIRNLFNAPDVEVNIINKTMDINDLQNKVYYETVKITEGREANGSYRGNGHHLAQEICEAIMNMLKDTK